DDPNGTFNGASGINSRGDIVGIYGEGSYFDNIIGHGYLLSHGQYTTLDDPNGINGTWPFGINASGQVVGYYWDTNFVSHGFLLSGGQYTTLDAPNAIYTFPTGINDHGQIVGQYYDASFNSHGFLLNGGQFTNIDGPNGSLGGSAVAINSRGDIIGGFTDANF